MGAPRTADELRAVGGFSFVVLKRNFPDIAGFFDPTQPQRVFHIGRLSAALFALEPPVSGSFDKNGRFGTNQGTKPAQEMPFFPCAACAFSCIALAQVWYKPL